MDVDVRLPSDSSNFMLSSMELTESSELNKSLSDSSENSLQKDSLIDISINLSESAELNALKQQQAELEAEYARLKTIQEESSVAIDLTDDESECLVEQTDLTANDGTDFTNENQTENNMVTENTLQYILDERNYFQQSLLELGRRVWKSTQEEQHYTKGCLWSPDGTCVLVPVHLDGMHIMELPHDLYNMNNLSLERNISKLATAVHVKEGGTVYDLAWYPFMNSEVPDSCCWLATRQHEPIHLFDAFNGELRCSYRGYDQVDEVEAAISVIFSNNGEKVIGGYKKNIKIFDTNVPGRDYDSIAVKKAVACFALSTQNDDTLTTGSWNGYIDHYDLRARQAGSLFTLGGHNGGVTWLKYSKNDPIMLLSGARRDNKILQWDMRSFRQPLQQYERTVTTNQRVYFDLSPQEEWLVSGDCEGLLRIWDLKAAKPECKTEEHKQIRNEVPIHKDCCNGVNFHPTLPILATSAGQYHFVDVASDAPPLQPTEDLERKIVKYENSVIFLGINGV